MFDPSQLYRPEERFEEYNIAKLKKSRTNRTEDDFRNYEDNLNTETVLQTYTLMHTYQTLDFARSKVNIFYCFVKIANINITFHNSLLTII